MYQIVLTVNTAEIGNYSLMDGHQSQKYALSADASILAKSAMYFLTMTISMLLSFVFVIFPALLLILYPTTVFQQLLSKCTSNQFRITLNIFIEKFHCCCRDGLDSAKGRRSFQEFTFWLE